MTQKTYFDRARIFSQTNIFLTIISFLIVGCATTPKYDGKKEVGKWEAKAQITDLKTGKKNNVNLEMIAQWPNKLRMEVTGSFGVNLASVALDQGEIQYSIYRQKKYFHGPVSAKSMLPLFQIQFDPGLFFNVLFDQPLKTENWNCLNNGDGKVAKCTSNVEAPISIEWRDRSEEAKRVVMSGKDFEIQAVFKNFSSKVEDSPDLYSLKVPKVFVKYKLN